MARPCIPGIGAAVRTLGALVGLLGACGDDASGPGPGGTASGVEIAEHCEMPDDCGGDPIGSWEVVSGCTEAPEAGFECDTAIRPGAGSVSGTVTISTGSFNYDIDTELRQCGWIDGSGDGGGTSLTIEDNVLRVGNDREVTFCVDGDTLWLHEEGLSYPNLTVMTLHRAGDAGTP